MNDSKLVLYLYTVQSFLCGHFIGKHVNT